MHFFPRIWALFWLKMPLFTKDFVNLYFWQSFRTFWRFRSEPVLWDDCWVIWRGDWWVFGCDMASYFGGYPQTPQEPTVPLPPNGIHLPVRSLRHSYLAPPAVDTEVHTSPLHRRGASFRVLLTLNDPEQPGWKPSFYFIVTFLLVTKWPKTFRLWVASGRLGQHPWD